VKQLLCSSSTGSFNSFFTISLPINIIFPLSLVYGIMGASLYYVVMRVCMIACMNACMQA